MPLNGFWTGVREELRRYDLLTHPFYQAWSAGKLTCREIGYYGSQYLNHIAAFPTYLTALHCRLPESAMRCVILRNAAEEETGARSHADLWRQFVREIEPEQAANAQVVLPEMGALIETYRDLARNGAPAAALGAFYAFESQIPRIAAKKLAGLRKFYGASEAACEYFAVHLTADVHHAKVWRTLIDDSIQENQANAEQAMEGLRHGACALWQALDGIDAARQHLPN